MNNIINEEEYERQTVAALYRSLTFSLEKIIEKYDPDHIDVEGRANAKEFDEHLRKAIKLAYAEWIAEVN